MFNKKSKRGIVSLTTFSLLIVVMVLVIIFSYNYYSTSKDKFELKIKKEEVLNSVISFRSSLIDLNALNNSYINYTNSIDDLNIEIILRDKIISGNLLFNENNIQINISSLSILFCDTYTFNPKVTNTFYNNDTCIVKIN